MGAEIDRRHVLATGIGATAVITAVNHIPGPATAADAGQPVKVPAVIYQTKPMPFDPSKIKGISEKILVSHYENNYTGAVKRLNAISAQLASLDWATAPNFVINGLKREELTAMNSMILHDTYFESIGGEGMPSGALAEAIKRDFGGIDRWSAEFAAMGKALGGGSGWVLLAYSPRDKRLINTFAAEHTMTLGGGRLILALDMYEHAYHMDFGARSAAYVDAYMNVIRWDIAERNFIRYSGEG